MQGSCILHDKSHDFSDIVFLGMWYSVPIYQMFCSKPKWLIYQSHLWVKALNDVTQTCIRTHTEIVPYRLISVGALSPIDLVTPYMVKPIFCIINI